MACDPKITPAQKDALLKSIEQALGHSAAAQAAINDKLGQLLAAQVAKPFGPGSVKNIIVDGILGGHSLEEIVGTIKQYFPDSKAGKAEIAYYKTQLKKEGKLAGYKPKAPKTGPAAPASPFPPDYVPVFSLEEDALIGGIAKIDEVDPHALNTLEADLGLVKKYAKSGKYSAATDFMKDVETEYPSLDFTAWKAKYLGIAQVPKVVKVDTLAAAKIQVKALAQDLGITIGGADGLDSLAQMSTATLKQYLEKINLALAADDGFTAKKTFEELFNMFDGSGYDVTFSAQGLFEKINTKILAHYQAKLYGDVSIPMDVLNLAPDELDQLLHHLKNYLDQKDLDALQSLEDLGVAVLGDAKQQLIAKNKLVNQFNQNPPATVAEIFTKGLKQGKSPEEIQEAIKVHGASSKTATDAKAFKNSLAYYKTQLKKAGELPGQQDAVDLQVAKNASLAYTPTPAKPLGLPLAADQVDAKTVLGQKVGEASGSNPGGVYIGTDGVKRYVKFYPDQTQGYVEHVSNQLYRQLGLDANESGVFDHQGGKAYWSKYNDGVKTVQQTKLTKNVADQILDGFAADVLTANWDVVGLNLDNVGVIGGKVVRLDNGGSLLFRAKAGRKDASLLHKLTEIEAFTSKNPAYAKVFTAAGYSNAMDLGERFIKQIDAIEALHKKHGTWANLLHDLGVKQGLPATDYKQIVDMLEARAKLLYQRRNEIRAYIDTAAQRAANRAVAAREIIERQKVAAAYRDAVEVTTGKRMAEELAKLPDSVKQDLKAFASTGHAAADQAMAIRDKLLKELVQAELKLSDAEYAAAYKTFKSQVSDWYGSSSSSGAGEMKAAIEDLFPDVAKTTHHHGYLDHDAGAHARFRGNLPLGDGQRKVFRAFMLAEKRIAKAYLKELTGKETLKLTRGVYESYFSDAKVPVPKPGQEWVDVGNPLASWAGKKTHFGSLAWEAEVSIDDVWAVYHLQPHSRGYWSEKEFFVMGRPQFVKRYR
jgi:hypothetical protein